ncbi:MAG TPA: hypothetical protein VGW38_19515, partial [Chloroflexota bacterium]|nr:hypothetical protein [Chloroflexota bacterium]
ALVVVVALRGEGAMAGAAVLHAAALQSARQARKPQTAQVIRLSPKCAITARRWGRRQDGQRSRRNG